MKIEHSCRQYEYGQHERTSFIHTTAKRSDLAIYDLEYVFLPLPVFPCWYWSELLAGTAIKGTLSKPMTIVSHLYLSVQNSFKIHLPISCHNKHICDSIMTTEARYFCFRRRMLSINDKLFMTWAHFYFQLVSDVFQKMQSWIRHVQID